MADVAHLSLAHELVERAECLLERRDPVEPVVLVEVDVVGTQTAKRSFDRLVDVGTRASFDGPVTHVHAELRSEHDPVAPPFEHLAEKVFAAAAVSVDVRGVEKGDPDVERGVDDRSRLLETEPATEVVAAETDNRDLWALGSQTPRTHRRDATDSRMHYRRLGSSDLEVSELALGSWLTYGGGVAQEQAKACVEKAFDATVAARAHTESSRDGFGLRTQDNDRVRDRNCGKRYQLACSIDSSAKSDGP